MSSRTLLVIDVCAGAKPAHEGGLIHRLLTITILITRKLRLNEMSDSAIRPNTASGQQIMLF
jgi:hypothetical protein